MAHQNLISKIFCFCCKDCKEPHATDDPKTTSETQGHQSPNSCLWSQKKHKKRTVKSTKSPTPSSLEQLLIQPEKKDTYNTNSDFIDDISNVSPRGFYKRNLNRYSQQHWPYQPCLIGKP